MSSYPRDPSCVKFVRAYDEPEGTSIKMSDNILCNNLNYFDFYQAKDNNQAFCWQMQGCVLPGDKMIDSETHLWRGKKEDDCTIGLFETRGGNAKDPTCGKKVNKIDVAAGYDNYTANSLENYLLVPCKQNTFRNYVNCDQNKCCSIRHQMFMNLTKRI